MAIHIPIESLSPFEVKVKGKQEALERLLERGHLYAAERSSFESFVKNMQTLLLKHSCIRPEGRVAFIERKANIFESLNAISERLRSVPRMQRGKRPGGRRKAEEAALESSAKPLCASSPELQAAVAVAMKRFKP